jgi:hypothetical protein
MTAAGIGGGVATEALLDGQPGQTDGLQVTIADTRTNQTFSLGAVSCYTDSCKLTLAIYPNAAYSVSSSSSQTVARNVGNARFSNNFAISESFPLAAGTPYEGGRATIQLRSTYTGTGNSGTIGTGTGPHRGQPAASTPRARSELPETLGKLLPGAGFRLALAGVLLYLRGQRSRPFQPPTVSS